MENKEPKYPFSMEDWKTCMAVLEAIKDDPLNNPNNEQFKSLITKIRKNSRKELRKESYGAKKKNDLKIKKDSVIVKQALNGQTTYSLDQDLKEKEKVVFQQLKLPQNCYCCNQSFQKAHFFYSRICPTCALLNYEKRFASIDLKGQTAILTGCRVKVGYATALKLLRSGATVIGTTRFPALALEQFQKETDYKNWENELHLYGLDLRNLKAIEAFISYVKSNFSAIDILVNNAAQTIRYTDNYYAPLIRQEQKLTGTTPPALLIPNKTPVAAAVNALEMSEMSTLKSSEVTRFGQPVDKRDKTSWNSKLEEVSMVELLEVNLINQIAPYYLIKELKTLMQKSVNGPKHIINVTSSEGIFSYHNKTSHHPHTNMTKASLNMLTRTSASDFAKDGIYMNCVDVGWISTGAKESLRKKQFEQGYVPPLDSVDGASRIMDLIIEALNGNVKVGKLLKNYTVHDW